MSQQIKRVIESAGEPSHNDLWLDPRGDVPGLKTFRGGKWVGIDNTDLQPIREDISVLQGDVNTLSTSKVDKVTGKGLSTNDFTDELKTKYNNAAPSTLGTDGQVISLQSGAPTWVDPTEGSIIDTELSGDSTNPVQNKVITSAISQLGQNLDTLNSITFGTFSGTSVGTTETQFPVFLKAGNVKITLSCASNAYGEAKIYDANDNAVSTGIQYIAGGSSVEVTITIPNDGVKIGLFSASGSQVQFDVEAEETLYSLFETKKIANDAHEAAVYARDNALGIIKKQYSTNGEDEFICDLQAGIIECDISSSAPGYSSIVLYDAAGSEMASQTGIYTDSGISKHYTFTTNSVCKRIKIRLSNDVQYTFLITSDKSLLKDVDELRDYVDEVDLRTQQFITQFVPIDYATYSYDWVVNGQYSIGMTIAENGVVSRGVSGSALHGMLNFLDNDIYFVNINCRNYLEGGVYSRLFAFYSDLDIYDETTFLGGSSIYGNGDTGEYSFNNIAVPKGAKVLIVLSYEPQTKYSLSGNKFLLKNCEKNSQDIVGIKERFTLDDVKNGTPIFYATGKDFELAGNGSYYDPIADILVMRGGVNTYYSSGIFNPSGNRLVHVKFKVPFWESTNSVLVMVSTSDTSLRTSQSIGTINAAGEYDMAFDATYLRIYQGFSNAFSVWFYTNLGGMDFKVEGLRIFEANADALTLATISGITAKELFKSTDENITDILKEINKPSFMVSPSGNKYVLIINQQGEIVAKPTIPTKMAYFGNSLMFGNSSNGVGSFGMCASDSTKDFYALINSFCLSLNPSFVANRYSSVPFETINDVANIDSVVASTVANLIGDEDLIVIQAGDNTTDAQSFNIMPTSTVALLGAIRQKCPNAIVCWPAIWYSTAQKMKCVRDACKKMGAYIINIADLNVKENCGTIGGLIDFGQVGTDVWTVENVSNVVENSENNITVTFTYDGVTTSTTLDVSSYNLNGSILSYSGRYRIITLQWGHPGDRGMKAIANRILYQMGISDDENTYLLD